jgi:NAD(P)-dependent dehydrogenase (short-subunit alcohol dehydrogenase family)
MGEKCIQKSSTQKSEVVVVTGASAGVGRAVVREFAKHGARIGLLARGRAGLKGARRDVEQLGGKALAIPTDVADAAQVYEARKKVEVEFGPIDIWVNVAMASVFSPIREMTAEDYQRVTNVTYLGYVYGSLAALKTMLPRDRGTIVQVGSALAYRSIPLQSAYCAAKHAIVGFTDSLRCELVHDRSNVHVTCVHLPAMNTPQFGWVKSRLKHKAQPVPPIYQPEVAARAIYWAAHHRRREVWVGGSTVEAIVGQRLIPGLLDQYLGKTGFQSQQTAERESLTRGNNLYRPLDDGEDHGVHGTFGDRASKSSDQVWADLHRRWIVGGLLAGASAAAAWWSWRQRRGEREKAIELPRAA